MLNKIKSIFKRKHNPNFTNASMVTKMLKRDKSPEFRERILRQNAWSVVMNGQRIWTFADGSAIKEAI